MSYPISQAGRIVLVMGGAGGVVRWGKVGDEGLKMVMRLRSEYAEPKKALTDTARYMDGSYLVEAGK